MANRDPFKPFKPYNEAKNSDDLNDLLALLYFKQVSPKVFFRQISADNLLFITYPSSI